MENLNHKPFRRNPFVAVIDDVVLLPLLVTWKESSMQSIGRCRAIDIPINRTDRAYFPKDCVTQKFHLPCSWRPVQSLFHLDFLENLTVIIPRFRRQEVLLFTFSIPSSLSVLNFFHPDLHDGRRLVRLLY